MNLQSAGLESWGVYIPEERHTSEYMSKETGIPKEIIEEKDEQVPEEERIDDEEEKGA